MKIFPIVLLAMSVLLDGCYTPFIEGAQQGYDASRRKPLKTDINTPNDVISQFKLGNTYCCKGGGPMDNLTIYDNNKATYWYCKSARQGYGPSQLQLARLYSGHAIRGFHVVLRASSFVGNPETDLSIALMWANLAANNTSESDVEDAVELSHEIVKKATREEVENADILMKKWRTASCSWGEVFPDSKTTEK